MDLLDYEGLLRYDELIKKDIAKKITGPSSSTDAHIVVFDGTIGKTVKDSGFTIEKSVPSNAVFTDTNTKVTSVNNHYAPSADVNSELTASLSGTAGTFATNTEYTVLTGVKAQRDAKGHVTGLTYTAQKVKDTTVANTDTKVTQTATTTSAAYELLFSGTADNTTRTEGAGKTSTLTYNPSTKALSTGGTVNDLTLSAQTTGFKVSGGTTSKTLTVGADYTLGAACAKGVTDNSSNADVTSSDTNLITGRTLYYQLAKKGYTTNTGTVTGVTVGTGGTNYTPTNGVVTIPAYPTSLPASDVSSWAKASSKPSYAYSEIGYTVNTTSSAGGTLSLAGTTPLHVVTLTGNVSALTLSANPAEGHSCHVILTAASAQTVAIAHDSTNRVCPGAEDISLDIPAGGYIELDFLTANSKVYVRGV